MPKAPSSHSLDTRITRVVKGHLAGTVFTPRDFATMGNRGPYSSDWRKRLHRTEKERFREGKNREMRPMFLTDPLPFDQLLGRLREAENRMNSF